MGEIRIVGPGKTRGYPYPVCKKGMVETKENMKSVRTTVHGYEVYNILLRTLRIQQIFSRVYMVI